MRRFVLIVFAVFLASGLAWHPQAQTSPAAAATVRKPDQIFGAPIYGQKKVERYARSVGCTRYIMKTIPLYYKLAPKRGMAPDVLVAQAILERHHQCL